MSVKICEELNGVYGYVIEVELGSHFFLERRKIYATLKSAQDALTKICHNSYNYRISPLVKLSNVEYRDIIINNALLDKKPVKLVNSFKLTADYTTFGGHLIKSGSLIAKLVESWERVIVLSNSKQKGFTITHGDLEQILKNNLAIEVDLADQTSYKPHFSKKIKEALLP